MQPLTRVRRTTLVPIVEFRCYTEGRNFRLKAKVPLTYLSLGEITLH